VHGDTTQHSEQDGTIFIHAGDPPDLCWSGRSKDAAVVRLTQLPGSTDALVLLDDMAVQSNLLRIDSGGNTIWAAEVPGDLSTDNYVHFDWDGLRLTANSWSSCRVSIDVGNGRIIERVFTK